MIKYPRGLDPQNLVALASRDTEAELVLVTEHHCAADPNLVQQVIEYFDRNPGIAGAGLSVRNVGAARLAPMERRWFTEHAPGNSLDSQWNLLKTYGYVVRSSALRAAGGIPHEFGLFNNTLLGARLHQMGLRVATIPDAVVTHHNSEDYADHQRRIHTHICDECRYRLLSDATFCDAYFGHAPEWSDRAGYHGALDCSAVLALARASAVDLAHGYVRDSGLAELATGLAWALFGSRSRLTVAKWVNAWTELRTYVLAQFPEAGWRAYIRSWETRIRATRIEMALAHRDGPSDPVMLTHLRGIEEILEHQRLGFHALESWNGEAFRWGAPLARLRVSLPPGAGEIVLDTRELRGPVDRYLRGVSWGTRAVPRRDIRAIRGELHCRLRGPSGPRWLTVVTRPLPPALNGPRDSRRLGIPLFALRSR